MFASLFIAIVVPWAAAGQATTIDSTIIARHASVLSHDSMLGRFTGSPQNAVAASYIAAACGEAGLEPLGDTFLLPVPLIRSRILPGTRLDVTTSGRSTSVFHGTDFIHSFATRQTHVGFSGSAQLVGTDQEVLNGEVPELNGRIAVTLGTVSNESAEKLATNGASAVVHLVGTQDAYQSIRDQMGNTRTYPADNIVSSFASPLPSLIASPDLSQILFQSLRTGSRVDLAYTPVLESSRIAEQNVACALRGTNSGRGTVLLTAHFDHLGVGIPNADGDSIYNGFSDNAAGVAMLLAIGTTLKRSPVPPEVTVAFLFLTGEELGLLGSDYFVGHPVIPLSGIEAVINLDAGAPPAPPRSWRIAGGDTSALGATAVSVARARGWDATVSPAVPNSDYFPFVRVGVPSIFIIPGPGPYDGFSVDSSNALRRVWDRYHHLDDEWRVNFPLSGLVRYAEFAMAVALAIDQDPSSPASSRALNRSRSPD